MVTAEHLIEHLHLKAQNETTFIGTNFSVGSPNVFGGQVLAQAINAAYQTITNGRLLHSMHSYFLEAGNLDLPISYKVDIMRDGGSFSTRRITAMQGDLVIFILACSFHKQEDGYEHHVPMKPNVKPPEELMSWSDALEKFGDFLPKRSKAFLEIPRPIEFKPVDFANPFDPKDMPPQTEVWFKLKGNVSGLDLPLKQQILTYISDYNILSVALHRHGSKAHWGNTLTASLDHSMWYFRDFDFDDWLLYALDSPSTSNARGFCRGHIFTRYGKLVASVTQEGLMRPLNQ